MSRSSDAGVQLLTVILVLLFGFAEQPDKFYQIADSPVKALAKQIGIRTLNTIAHSYLIDGEHDLLVGRYEEWLDEMRVISCSDHMFTAKIFFN